MKKYFERLYKGTRESFYVFLDDCLVEEQKQFIITANPETFMVATKNECLNKALLDKRTICVADGIALVKTSRKFHIHCNKITGVDITYQLLKYADARRKKIYLFGATVEVINKTVNVINKQYPNIKIVGFQDGYVADKAQVFEKIARLEPDIVLVALGIPAQENLIYQNFDKLKKGILVGVGGTFDVLSGSKKRAPKLFQKLNLEWLYRIITEPKRWKRFYQNNIKFVFKIWFMKK